MTATFKLLLIFAVVALSACDKTATPTPVRTVSVAYLKSLCHGEFHPIRKELAIEGRIVSSNLFEESRSVLILEDTSGGISLVTSHPAITKEYPFGTRVRLYCNSLMLRDFGGKIRLTAIPRSSDDDRITAEDLKRRLIRYPDHGTRPEPRVLSFTDLSPRDIDTYVKFRQCRFTDRGRWCDYDSIRRCFLTTERQIRDRAGNTFRVRISGNAAYADLPLPYEECSLRGVIDYFNGNYTLRMTDFGTTD